MVQSFFLDNGLLLELHTLTQAACSYVIDNEAVFHSTISAMARDISPPMPPSNIVTVKCYSNKQIVTYADTSDPPSFLATLSHVAINSMVGVKLPEDGNNSCS